LGLRVSAGTTELGVLFLRHARSLTHSRGWRNRTDCSQIRQRSGLLHVWDFAACDGIDADGGGGFEAAGSGDCDSFIFINAIAADADGAHQLVILIEGHAAGELDEPGLAVIAIAVAD